MISRNLKFAYIACGVLLFVAAAVAVFLVSNHFAMKQANRPVTESVLMGLDGKPWRVAYLNEKIGVIFFGYTFCPDVCPTALNSLAIALAEMDESARSSFKPIFVSVDPERDTPRVIGDYVKQFDKSIMGLTGSQTQLWKFARAFGASYVIRKKDEKDGFYPVDHTTRFHLVRADGSRINVPEFADPDALRTALLEAANRFDQ